jgi:hypothetical protein
MYQSVILNYVTTNDVVNPLPLPLSTDHSLPIVSLLGVQLGPKSTLQQERRFLILFYPLVSILGYDTC